MDGKLGSVSKIVLAVIIAAGIGFGAKEAFAAETAFSCFYSPPSQLGECTSTPQCDGWCVNDWDGIQGTCIGGCCFCQI
jgi:hypothetical protein